jgi:hypothetical protein
MDTAGWVSINTAIELDKSDYDCSDGSVGFIKDEILDPKKDLAALINSEGNITDPATGQTYQANSFAEPGGDSDTNVQKAVRTSGYTSGRNSCSGNASLTSWNLYKNRHTVYWYGGSTTETTQLINSVCMTAAENGLVVFLLGHGIPPAIGENSWSTIAPVLKAWNDSGMVRVCSAEEMAAELRRAPWTYDDESGVATRNYLPMANYRLATISACWKAGLSVGLTEDFDGVLVGNPPNIGAFETPGDVLTVVYGSWNKYN